MTLATSSCFSSGAETRISRPASLPVMMIGSFMPDAAVPAAGRDDPGTPRTLLGRTPVTGNISRRAWTVGATSACLSGYIRTARVKLVDLSRSSMTL